jgi:hypothetical protein
MMTANLESRKTASGDMVSTFIWLTNAYMCRFFYLFRCRLFSPSFQVAFFCCLASPVVGVMHLQVGISKTAPQGSDMVLLYFD